MNGNHNPERIATIETRKQQVEDQIYLTKTLPDKIGVSVSKELSKISLNITETVWTQPVIIDLSIARTTGVPFGTYPEGDCIVYLPDSDGIVTVYQMGTYYFKLRAPFHTLYIENAVQSGFCYLQIGKGDIGVERITMTGIDLQAQYTHTIDSTTDNLLANGIWTSSSWFDAANYGYITILASADVTGTLYLQYSNDGVNIHNEVRAATTLTTLSTGDTLYAATIMSARPARYVRPAFINGGTAQSSFSLTALARVCQ